MYQSFRISLYKSKLFTSGALMAIVLVLYLTLMSTPNSFAVKEGSLMKINEVNVYDDDTYTYKCSESVSIDTNGVNLNASKTSSSFVGAWKISANNDQEISGSITSGKIMPNDKEGLTPVSFSGTIMTDTMCNHDTSRDLYSDAIEISTYCFGDDEVYLTFKEIATSEDLAHVQCS